jgi:hypothetical protein
MFFLVINRHAARTLSAGPTAHTVPIRGAITRRKGRSGSISSGRRMGGSMARPRLDRFCACGPRCISMLVVYVARSCAAFDLDQFVASAGRLTRSCVTMAPSPALISLPWVTGPFPRPSRLMETLLGVVVAWAISHVPKLIRLGARTAGTLRRAPHADSQIVFDLPVSA